MALGHEDAVRSRAAETHPHGGADRLDQLKEEPRVELQVALGHAQLGSRRDAVEPPLATHEHGRVRFHLEHQILERRSAKIDELQLMEDRHRVLMGREADLRGYDGVDDDVDRLRRGAFSVIPVARRRGQVRAGDRF